MKFKDGKSLEQAAEEVLRHLLNLRNEGKISITLEIVGERIECTISYVN